MLHADIVYVLNAARLPALSDEREKVERVGTRRLGSGEAQQTGRRPDWESAHNYLTIRVVQLWVKDGNCPGRKRFPSDLLLWKAFFWGFKMIQTFERPYAVSAKGLFVPR